MNGEMVQQLTDEQKENLLALNRTARKEAYRAMRRMQSALNRARKKPAPKRKWKHSDPRYGQKLAQAMRKHGEERRWEKIKELDL